MNIKIISYSDTAGYDTVVCPEGTKNNSTSTPDDDDKLFKKAVGWKCARPSFDVKFDEDGGRTLSADKAKVVSVSFGFSAEWNDLGKAGEYKFAIKQNRKPLDASDSSAGDDTWLKNKKKGSEFFDTLEEINSFEVKFGSENDGLDDEEKGVYSYTLYIVSKSETEVDESKVLVNVAALDTIQVTEDVNLPEALLDVEGGYKDKVVLEISKFDNEVKYKITRIMLEGSPQEGESKEQEFDLAVFCKRPDGKYEDNSVQGNCRYSYILTATNPSGAWKKSPSREAKTLGTPNVSFNREALSYDSITISFYGVLAAEKYVVQFGASGSGFGGGATFEITKDGDEWVGSSFGDATAKVEFAANKFTVTINKPYGYDDATIAGDTAELTVTAHSSNDNAPSNTEQVNVVGPALLGATVNTFAEAKEDSISVTWKAVEGAKGYLIRRVMYSDAAMTNVAEESEVTYYCEGEKITYEGVDTGERVKISKSGDSGKEIFTLTDNYKEPSSSDADLAIYEKAQAKVAWGLPFRYVVLPVLESGDFGFVSNSLALKSGKVAYKNLAPTAATATLGYGLNLVADKAKNGTTQKIAWNVPNKLNETQTAIYRRMYTTDGKRNNEFVRVVNFSSNDTGATILVENDNLCNAYEYIVKYYEKGVVPSPDISLPDSLFKEVAKQTEEPRMTSRGEKIEQKNKGYLLAVDFKTGPHPNPDSKSEYTYAEQISWTPWDYNMRAVGPETMELTMRNYNIDAEEHGVFLITIDKTTGKISVDLKKIDDDTDVEEADFASAYNVKSKALVAQKGTASGMLKVLRDSPHYTLTLKNGEEIVSYEKGAYRHITCEELVRAATLAMAYGIQQTGTDWATVTNSRDNSCGEDLPGRGSAIVKNVGGSVIWDKLVHYFTFTDFTPAMPTRAGEKAVFLTINGTMTGTTDAGGSLGQHYAPKTYTNGSFTVRAAEDGELYKATITISSLTVNGASGLKVKYSDGSGEKEFGNITPFVFGNGNGKYSAKPLEDGAEEWK